MFKKQNIIYDIYIKSMIKAKNKEKFNKINNMIKQLNQSLR
jgi:hypothetical protein